MKEYVQSNKKGLMLVLIATIILVIIFITDNSKSMKTKVIDTAVTIIDSRKEINEEEKIGTLLNENLVEINFLADTFQIDRDILIERLKNDENIGELLSTSDNISKVLIDYLYNLESTEKDLFKKDITPCSSSKEYMIALISYFSNLYGNVDFTIAAAIAEVESGYSAITMLKRNNIFGGMSSRGLIRYKNIEYGILSYIKLLSDGYFSQGLNTIEDIGRVYNPMINENGIKIAKPTWVTNVNSAQKTYQEIIPITNITEVMALKQG